VAPGPPATRFTFKLVFRFDNDASVQLARRYLIDIESIWIMLVVHPGQIQAFPTDEIVVQRMSTVCRPPTLMLLVTCQCGLFTP